MKLRDMYTTISCREQILIKCGFPHWETKALIRNDIKKMEVLV